MVDIIDDAEVSRAQKSGKPRRDASFRVAINWWTGFAFVLLLVVVYQGFTISSLSELAAKNVQIEYVKLYPNGTSERGKYQKRDVAEFLPNTIDALIKNYIVKRYGVFPATIKQDYGEVGMFISDNLYKNFIAKEEEGGFDAINKAAALSVKPEQREIVRVENIWINHYDEVRGVVGGKQTDIVRSNVYYEKVKVSPSGEEVKGSRVAKVVPLQWHLIPLKQLEKLAAENPTILDHNPIGLEIIDSTEQDDPAGLGRTAGDAK
ncbi:hypothetical protein [Stutzerimonas kunmingensis]|uniref:hypothetical protein n=1 Tax=Stutzerimonas kunmingensis TaxID=1211807 RepID=UPI0028AAC1AD|nr:hypothetical protein [Stutzerimonas kunmingensis]